MLPPHVWLIRSLCAGVPVENVSKWSTEMVSRAVSEMICQINRSNQSLRGFESRRSHRHVRHALGIAGWSRPVFCTDGEGDRCAPVPSSPPLDLRVVTTDVMPIRNRLPLWGRGFDSRCSRASGDGHDGDVSLLVFRAPLGSGTKERRDRYPQCPSTFALAAGCCPPSNKGR